MEQVIQNKVFEANMMNRNMNRDKHQNLTHAQVNRSYAIRGIQAQDSGIRDFLFTLGCYEGQMVTVISVLAENYIIHIKDARYSIDEELARAIWI